ncbi:sarcospan-like [Babylonia areolata]|uniref:sarcospan-like n=1 Tax=Babylonia areolata TaxID=304850 RepID=UPI003FD029A5
MVITSRPRAHSASSIKLNQVLHPERHSVVTASALLASGGGCSSSSSSNNNNNRTTAAAAAAATAASGKKLSVSSPELRSMLVGLETTVPQNLNPSHLGSRHKPRRKRGGGKMGSRASLSTLGRERGSSGVLQDSDEGCCECCCLCCRRCCSCGGGGGGGRGVGGVCCQTQLFLVVMQMVVGVGVSGVSGYMFFFLPAFILRDCPLWAGAPLSAAGLLGIIYCAVTHRYTSSRTTKAFVLKILCSILSVISSILCATAAIFTGIHLGRIFAFVSCQETTTTGDNCRCFLPPDDVDDILPRIFVYQGLVDCQQVFCQVKVFLLVVCSLCLVGSLFSLWLAILLWKARYGRFHSGVRLPSVKRRYSVC